MMGALEVAPTVVKGAYKNIGAIRNVLQYRTIVPLVPNQNIFKFGTPNPNAVMP